MVEITKFNYETLLDELFDAVRDADFVAIDTNVETTGLVMFNEVINPNIIANDWYKSILDTQTTRSSTDFGVAIFKKEESQDEVFGDGGDTGDPGRSVKASSNSTTRYSVKCYSIPINFAYVQEHDARSESRRLQKVEQRLHFDQIGLEFIQRTKLDLNKVLYGGTPFMNRELQDDAMSYMKTNPDFMMISGKHSTNGDLDKFYFPKLIEKLEQKDMEEIISRLRGIAKFFDVTAETKKPIIGHNMLIKLIMLYKDFVEYLPQLFSEFLGKLNKVLPQFYDTKYMAWEIGNRPGVSALKKSMVQSHDLFQLYRSVAWVGKSTFDFKLNKETDFLYAEDLEDLTSQPMELERDGFCHESGFDACVSGMVFARLAYIVRNENDAGFTLDNEFFLNKCQVWRNKMFIQDEIKHFLKNDLLQQKIAKLNILCTDGSA